MVLVIFLEKKFLSGKIEHWPPWAALPKSLVFEGPGSGSNQTFRGRAVPCASPTVVPNQVLDTPHFTEGPFIFPVMWVGVALSFVF